VRKVNRYSDIKEWQYIHTAVYVEGGEMYAVRKLYDTSVRKLYVN
jgi:hypothetical protein